MRRTESIYNSVVDIYGPDFVGEYGWAAKHLGEKRPRFFHLEEAAQRSRMRAHYKKACHSVHTGIKGITDQLGTKLGPPVMLAGPSNGGLDVPGQNAAITINQVNLTLFGPRWQFDDLVTLRVLTELQDKAVTAFARAGRQLKREEAERQQA